jgi:hypothetical protein
VQREDAITDYLLAKADARQIPLFNEDLIIHEFGHEYCSNHADANYYKALTKLGAKLKRMALDEPHKFRATKS